MLILLIEWLYLVQKVFEYEQDSKLASRFEFYFDESSSPFSFNRWLEEFVYHQSLARTSFMDECGPFQSGRNESSSPGEETKSKTSLLNLDATWVKERPEPLFVDRNTLMTAISLLHGSDKTYHLSPPLNILERLLAGMGSRISLAVFLMKLKEEDGLTSWLKEIPSEGRRVIVEEEDS